MNQTLELLLSATLIGAGATLVMDIWAAIQQRLFAIPPLNYAMVGRWAGHLVRGQFIHANIVQSPSVRGERPFGWLLHYLIGVAFAAMLLTVQGISWAKQPTLLPALITGLVSLLAPFFILQPGLGAGLAGRKTPKPWVTRQRSFIAHMSFGIGLYLAAWVWMQAFGLANK